MSADSAPRRAEEPLREHASAHLSNARFDARQATGKVASGKLDGRGVARSAHLGSLGRRPLSLRLSVGIPLLTVVLSSMLTSHFVQKTRYGVTKKSNPQSFLNNPKMAEDLRARFCQAAVRVPDLPYLPAIREEILENERINHFLQWFCDDVYSTNVLTADELAKYPTIQPFPRINLHIFYRYQVIKSSDKVAKVRIHAGAEEAAKIGGGGGQNMVPGHICMEKNYNPME